MERVLKLNQSFEPIEIISWKRAISLIFREKAEIIKEYEIELHSPRHTFKMPAVVRLVKGFKRPRKRVKFNTQNIILRDHFRCQYCGKKFPAGELTKDHVIPRAQGGKTDWDNIVSCCIQCNDKKRNRTPAQARMKLKKYPTRPDWVPSIILHLTKMKMPKQWREFCYFLDD